MNWCFGERDEVISSVKHICMKKYYTVCPRSSDPFYIVSYYIKWVTTSWTHSCIFIHSHTIDKEICMIWCLLIHSVAFYCVSKK